MDETDETAGDYVSTGRAARCLKKSRTAIWRMCEAGRIEGAFQTHTGGAWRIPRAVVARMRGCATEDV